ncbi:MAG: type II secretion system protein [Chlamydiales bacterium]
MKHIKRNITLMELMVVMVIIGIISTVIGRGISGSLEKGRKFKTQHSRKQLEEILLLQVALGECRIEDLKDSNIVEAQLKKSGLVAKVDDLLKDGWGDPYIIDVGEGVNEIKIISQHDEKSDTSDKS